MATTDGIYTPNSTGVAADVPAETLKMADSLKGRTVRSYTTTAARDAAWALYTTAQKKGVIAYVEGDGPYISDGLVWRRISVVGMNANRGNVAATTDANGIIVVNHGLISTPTTGVQITMEGDSLQVARAKPIVVLVNSSQFYVKFRDSATFVPLDNNPMSFYWYAAL